MDENQEMDLKAKALAQLAVVQAQEEPTTASLVELCRMNFAIQDKLQEVKKKVVEEGKWGAAAICAVALREDNAESIGTLYQQATKAGQLAQCEDHRSSIPRDEDCQWINAELGFTWIGLGGGKCRV